MLLTLTTVLLGFAPSATTTSPTSVAPTSATLNGTGNPRQEAATGHFRIYTSASAACSTSSGTRVPATGGVALGSGETPVAFSQPVTGLTPGASYWYCAFVTNASGTAVGAAQTFTLSAPGVSTEPPFSVSGFMGRLAGNVHPVAGVPTTASYFRFSTSAGACGAAFGTRVPVSGNAPASGITGIQNPVTLAPGNTYWFCAVAENSVGTSYGAVRSFTVAAPVVTTTAPTQVGIVVTFNGTANANGIASTGWFRYSSLNPGACNDTFGTRLPGSGGIAVGAETSPAAFGTSISSVAIGSTVWVCAIASNSVGTAFGAPVSYVVQAPPPPVAVTSSAALVDGPRIRFSATANANGVATTAWVRYSTSNPGACNDTFGTRIPGFGVSIGSGNTPVGYSTDLSTFTPGVTIWFCAVATSAAGTGLGQLYSITPGATAAGVMTLPATDVTASAATLNGLAQANNGGLAWFRYSSTDPGSCNDTFGTRVPASGGITIPVSQNATALSAALAGLPPGPLYFCAIASNEGGASVGVVHHTP
ncbi:MAG: hypothetical protein JNK82_02530 [Myxococcaceae bacterium]|nr:hypothetical protein [Myxococcaceae bacterium]